MLRWVALGLVLTTSVVVVISLFSGVTFADLAKLGYVTFALAAVASAARLPVQVLRFRVLVLGLAGDPKPNISGLALARVSSEFVSLSTPSTSMGFFILTAWLKGKGVDGGKALSICYFQILMEIYVGASLAIIAGIYVLTRGAAVLGLPILLVAAVLIVGYTVIFVIPALKGIKVPHFVYTFSSYLIGGPRANALYLKAVIGSLNFSLAAREILVRKNLPVVIKVVCLTIVEDFLAGTALWLVLNSAGLKIDPVSAVLAAYGVVAIAQIPVSIGGAGITELTMQAYLIAVYKFTSWASIVLWRIATYQVMLAITGVVFLFFVRKSTKGSTNTPQKTAMDSGAGKALGATASEAGREIENLENRFGVVKTFRFAIAGALGFGVTEVVLTIGLLLFYGKLSLPHASFSSPALLGLDVLSLVIGVSASFLINERITVHVPKTVKGGEMKRFRRFLKFQGVSGVGNIGIIVVQLLLLATFEIEPLLGTIIGAVVTYPVVYFISIRYVWKGHSSR